MRRSSLGLFIVVLVVIISAAEGAKECYVCGLFFVGPKDCSSPEKKDCAKLFAEQRAAESGSPPGSPPAPGGDKPAAVASPTNAPPDAGGGRKKRDSDFSCGKTTDTDGNVKSKGCVPKSPAECKDDELLTVKYHVCYCDSDLCNGSSLPKSISIWGLGLVALFVVLHSSKLL